MVFRNKGVCLAIQALVLAGIGACDGAPSTISQDQIFEMPNGDVYIMQAGSEAPRGDDVVTISYNQHTGQIQFSAPGEYLGELLTFLSEFLPRPPGSNDPTPDPGQPNPSIDPSIAGDYWQKFFELNPKVVIYIDLHKNKNSAVGK